jgi:thioredoxin-like negative regulator of GroEL
MNRDNLIIIGCLLALVGIYMYFNGTSSSPGGEKDVRSLIHGIAAKHRPRVVYFFANWCGACGQYGPVLKSAVAVYGNSIDFQVVNVDDPSYAKLKSQYHITSVPATIIFDSHGWPVFGESGCVDRLSLNDALRSVYMSTINESAKITGNNDNLQKVKAATKHKTNKHQ